MPDVRIDLDARRLGLAVMRLSKMEGPTARTVISKIIRAWDPMYGPVRGDRRYCSVRLAEHEAEVYRSLAIQSLLQCTYAAVYVDPEDPTTEVKVYTEKRPPKKATFNVRGGKRRLTRKSITRIQPEENTMAPKKKSTADVDELDGLDELNLDDDDDDDEDETPAPAKKSKTKAKAETPAEKRRRVKAEKAAAEAEEDDDDEDEDDAEDEDEDDDDEEEAPAPKKSSKSKAAPAKKKGKGTPVGRALPEGKFGVEQVAALAGTTGRAVRIYCRTNDIEKAEGLGRYAWSEKAATALAKKIKAGSK